MKKIILLSFLIFTLQSHFIAQPCTQPGEVANFSIGLGELCDGTFIIDLADGPGSPVPLCYCPATFPVGGCIGDVVSLNIPGVFQFVVPRNLGNGCGGPIMPTPQSDRKSVV